MDPCRGLAGHRVPGDSVLLASFALWLLVVLPAVPAKRLAEATFPHVDPLRRLFVGLWLYAFVVHFEVMLLGKAGLLTLPWMLAANAVVAAAALTIPRPAHRIRLRAMVWQAFSAATPHERVAGVLLAVAPIYALGFLMLNGQIFLWDDWAYHGPVVTGMMRSDSLEFFRHNFAMYYPFNPHLLNVYATLPTGDLQWVWLPFIWWMLVAATAWGMLAMAAPRRCREFLMLAGAVCLMAYHTRWFLHTMGSTDLFSAVGLLSAIVLARPRAGAGNREVRLNGLLCGLVVGYTMGVKSFFVLPGGVVALMCLYWSTWGRVNPPVESTRQWWTMAGKMATIGAFGVFLTGSYWYVKNLLMAGNPLFPVDFMSFPGPMTRKAIRKTAMVNFGDDAGWSAAFWKDAWTQYIAWPEPWGWVFTLGLLVGLGVLAAGLVAAVRRREAPVPVGLLPELMAASVILIAAYPFLPFSGTWVGHEHLVISRRYLVFCFFAGFAAWAYLAGVLVGGRAVLAGPVRLMLYLALALQWPLVYFWGNYPEPSWNWYKWVIEMADRLGRQTRYGIPWDPAGWAVAVLAIGALLAVRLAPGQVMRLRALGRVRMPIAGTMMAALMVLAVVRPMLVEQPVITKYSRWDSMVMVAGVKAMDSLPVDSRVASYSSNMWETWQNCGARGQFEPVYLHTSGEAMPQLHEAFAAGQIDPDDQDTFHRLGVPWQPNLSRPDLFADRLRASRVDYLHFAPYFGWHVPPQLDQVRAMADFALIYDDGYNLVFQHLDEPNEALTPMPSPPTLPSLAEWRAY